MELQTFKEDKKEKTLIDKILKIFIAGFLAMIVILLVDGTGVLSQFYLEFTGDWPDSWLIVRLVDWYGGIA